MPRLADLNPNTMLGPGDLSGPGDPQNACDCEDGCVRCDDELAAEADAERDIDPYDDGRWD